MDNDVLGGLPIALNHNPVGVLPTATHSCPPEPAPTTGPDLPAADPLPKAWTSFFPSSPCPLSQQTIHPKLRSRQIEFREQQRAFPTNLSAFEINAENLARRADGDQTVVITFATDGWQEFVVHWQHRLERLGVSNFFIVALDMQIFQSLYYPGAPLLLPSHMVSGKDNTRTQWGDESFHRIQLLKQPLLLLIIELGFNVLFSDADQIWLRNPLPYLASLQGPDILCSTDCPLLPKCPECVQDMYSGKLQPVGGRVAEIERSACNNTLFHFNVGFTLYRKTTKVLDFLREWISELEKPFSGWDQQVFNDLMLRGPASVQTMVNNTSPPGGVFYRMSNNELLMGALPVSLVSNGLAYWNQGMYRTQWSRAPFVVHSNYMGNTVGKRVWFREASLWEDSPGYFDSAGGFLTYSTHFSDEEIREALDDPSKNAALLNAQFSLLQNAFGVAQALDRVLVLPRLVGRFSRAPPRVLSEWGGATTDQVFNQHPLLCGRPNWPSVWEAPIREPGFLNNPRAANLMRSVGRVVVCSNETCHLSQRGNESVVNPAERRVITLNPVQNSDAIRWALEPLSSMKVLHFETMDGAFGGFAPLGKWCVQDALKGEPGVDVQCT